MKPNRQWVLVKNRIITDLRSAFGNCPQYFFSEHDIHSVLYGLAQEQLEHQELTTLDGYKTCIVHHEYPTPFRCDMKEYSFRRTSDYERTLRGGLYKRGHYDLVILNPEFVEKNELDIVCGKDYEKVKSILPKLTFKPLIWACEIIYFPIIHVLPQDGVRIVEQDMLKIKETLDFGFAEFGSVHVFTSHQQREALQLQQQTAQLAQKHNVETTFSAV
jgi:hypothetical protein